MIYPSSEVISCKLVVYFFLQKRQELISFLQNIKEMKSRESLLDTQCILDLWYFSKLAQQRDEFKPSDSFLRSVVKDIKKSCEKGIPEDCVFSYIYMRCLGECGYDVSSLQAHFNHIKQVAHRDMECYGYYLTHVIFYDLKFGLERGNDYNREPLNELVKLCETYPEIIKSRYCDLLAEIMLAFTLCNFREEDLCCKIEQIIENYHNISDYHTNSVIEVYSQLKKREQKDAK